ncbi:MAG: tetratricopeptide repeat protein, partial [Desulfobacterales bacterium]|nr:tetratricopeptide repeat protein [Desulfobacterales bacterium]
AELYERTGRAAAVAGLLDRALALDPDSPRVKTAIGQERLDRGKTAEAEAMAREVLEEYPEHEDALTLMGCVCLRRGDLEGAREHAIWALRQNPTDHDVLHLLAAIKARKSKLLGLWWCYHAWISELGQSRAILVLLGAFIVYRVAGIHLDQNDHTGMAGLLHALWLGVCIYTWVGPGLFRKSLKKETDGVLLNEDF